MSSERPTVSVAMITYNHEGFIAQAVESALRQQTDFPVEIVIGEDCSTDNTRAILNDLAQQHPGRLRLLLREQNVGMMRNFVETLRACRGEYIALLEGDDFWTDPTKLARQVEFLRSHPDFAICHHNAWKLTGELSPDTPTWHQQTVPTKRTLPDLLAENPIVTCTAMYRAGLFGEFPEWFTQAKLGDWLLHLLNAQHGAVGYLNRTMAAYRQHSGSTWSSQPRRKNLEGMIASYKLIVPDLPKYLQPTARRRIEYWHEEIVETFLQERDTIAAREHAKAAFQAGELKSLRGVGRLLSFYRGLDSEAAGQRWKAGRLYAISLFTGRGRTRLRAWDFWLALLRTGCPRTYRILRGWFGRRQ